MKKINLGSADASAEGWINVDIVPGTNVDVVANAKYLFMQEKPDVIRASHVLEHIPPNEAMSVLRTWKETLASGGTLIVGVPDFDYVVEQYVRDPVTHLRFWREGFDRLLFVQLYGPFFAHRTEPDNEPYRHHAVFNGESLKEVLADAGFTEIARFTAASVDENDGFDDAMLNPWSLNMRCVKPS